LIIILAIILAAVTVLLKRKTPVSEQDYPYCLDNKFLSRAELSFFGVLRQAVGENGIVFAKVRVADVISIRKNLSASKRQTAFNRIQSKHFDFIICTPNNIIPKAAIELDDSSHKHSARIRRDEFLNHAAKVAGLPLLRITAKNAYAIVEIREKLALYLELVDASQVNAAAVESNRLSEFQACPRCGSTMIRRHGKSGMLAGKKFWGCSQYPSCRSILPII
jgi:predicted RNA-binding Zn-ribbon protein involved in translation (DUF1610 family)